MLYECREILYIDARSMLKYLPQLDARKKHDNKYTAMSELLWDHTHKVGSVRCDGQTDGQGTKQRKKRK
jgi:hypothetical protein